MITCSICGGKTKVEGVEGDCGATYRRRKCVDCGHIIYTEETERKGAQYEFFEARHKYVKEYKQRAKK